ncbi:MAG: MBL fold metallo-hydrolase [Desulfohalobiaceae bacterium]
MPRKVQKQEVLCLGSKASLLGTSIPVWSFFLDGLLLDTGPFSLRKDFMPFYQEQHIAQAALTHYHEDHSGLAAWLQAEKQTQILMPAQSQHLACQRIKLPLYRKLFWGTRHPFQAHVLPGKICTEKYCLQVIPAPGHTRDHVVFLEQNQGWLFSGDVFVRAKPELGFWEEDMSAMLQTLTYLAGLDFELLFCSHSGPQPRGRQLLRQKMDHLLQVQERARQLKDNGWGINSIVSSIFPRKRPIEYMTRGEWSRKNLIQSLL